MIGYLLGVVLMIESAMLLIPTVVSALYGEALYPFLLTIGILLLVSLPLVIFKPKKTDIYAKDGLVCVAASWVLLSLFGALPFVISNTIPNYIDAVFETVSGFTTTGASIMPYVEGHAKGILFWRSLTHWIGGMGVLVFMLAIIPSANGQSMHLMRAEVPGPTKSKLVPKMRQTALILYAIYFVMTVIMVFALLLCKMPLYDSVVNSLATAGTGGFSVLNASIGGYNNPAAEWVIAIFMLLFGINFNIYYFILIKKFKDVVKNEELKVYLFVVIAATVAIAVNTVRLFSSTADSIRSALFQVATIISTTGFATADFNLWPAFSKTVLVLLMITGACASSTAGGLKMSRVIILFKTVKREILHLLRPRSICVVKLDGETVSDRTCHAATGYLSLYVIIIAATTLLISIDGFGLETNLTATLACINNIGPGLGAVGPTGNFAGYSYFSKILLTLNMLFGRLEIMPMLIFLSPFTWKKH